MIQIYLENTDHGSKSPEVVLRGEDGTATISDMVILGFFIKTANLYPYYLMALQKTLTEEQFAKVVEKIDAMFKSLPISNSELMTLEQAKIPLCQ